MSTILKALRRLEQERAKGAERPLREQVVVPRVRRRGPWAARLAAVAALALGFAVTWGMLGGVDTPPDPPAAAPAAPAPVAAAPPAALPRPAAVPAPPAAFPRPAAVPAPPLRPAAPAPVAGAGPAAVVSPAPHPPTTAAPDPTPVHVAVASAPPLPPRAEPPAPPLRSALPGPGATQAPAGESVVASPIPGRVPRLVEEEAPARGARAELPVEVVRTSWHPQAERRAAWVAIGGEGPREVKEGEWVGAYEVRSIEPDGVLFADGPLLVHRPVGQR